MNIEKLPYDSFDPSALVKLQGLVSAEDKNLLMTVIPNRGLFTFLLQHAIKSTADYIRANDLAYNPTDQQRLLDFITRATNTVRTDATARTPRPAVSRNDARTTKRIRGTSKGV